MIEAIRQCIHKSTFDCRHLLIESEEPDYELKMSEAFVYGYMHVKHGVANILRPKSICEVGVSSGISALAFLTACPHARYVGIDNRYEEEMRGVRLVDRAMELLEPFAASFLIEDSQTLHSLPQGPYDLIHIDGDHKRECCCHDVMLAWNALTPEGWLLIDAARDSAVAAGTFDAMRCVWPADLRWAYLDDTLTGNILIRKETPRP
jgi:predicted O-methyltransferase YrrM